MTIECPLCDGRDPLELVRWVGANLAIWFCARCATEGTTDLRGTVIKVTRAK